MKLQTHKIQKQSLILKFAREEEAMSWNRYAAEYNKNRIIPILNEVLDNFCNPDEYYTIEKLEVNIGDVSNDSFLMVLQQELQKQLTLIRPGFSVQIEVSDKKTVGRSNKKMVPDTANPAIGPKAFGRNAADPKILSDHQVKANAASISKVTEALVYFLDHGILPWNSIVPTISALQKQIIKHIGVDSLASVPELKLRMLNPRIRTRFYHQFSKNLVERVFTVLFHDQIESIRKTYQELIVLMTRIPQVKKVKLRKHSAKIYMWIGLEASENLAGWQKEYMAFYLKQMFIGKAQTVPFLTLELISRLKERTGEVSASFLGYLEDWQSELNVQQTSIKLQSDYLPQNFPAGNDTFEKLHEAPRQNFLKELKREENQGQRKNEVESTTSAGNLADIKQNIQEETDQTSQPLNSQGPQPENSVFHGSKVRAEDQKRNKELGTEVDYASENQTLTHSNLPVSSSKEVLWQKIGEPQKELPQYLDFYYLRHAGVILVWAYLNTLFSKLNYLEGNAFKTKKKQVRAVHLVTFLATGRECCEEPDQLIAKLLCGFPLHEQVKKNLRLNQKERDQSGIMLENLVDHWTIVKNTSVDGLRSSFFARDGKLLREENQWKMIVEQKSYDMLLDHLPYTISIIKLPWMNNILRVDWM